MQVLCIRSESSWCGKACKDLANKLFRGPGPSKKVYHRIFPVMAATTITPTLIEFLLSDTVAAERAVNKNGAEALHRKISYCGPGTGGEKRATA